MKALTQLIILFPFRIKFLSIFSLLLIYSELRAHDAQLVDSLNNQLIHARIDEDYHKLNSLSLGFYDINTDLSMEIANEALLLAKEDKNMEQEAVSLHNLGLFFKQADRLDKTAEYWEKSLAIIRKIGNDDKTSEAYEELGLLYRDLGDYDKATSCLKRALVLQRRLEERAAMAEGLHRIGQMYLYHGKKYLKALDYYRESFRIFEEIDSLPGMAVTLHKVGFIYYNLNRKKLALEYLKQGIILYDSLNNQKGIAEISNLIGEILIDLKEYDNALKYLESAILIFDEIHEQPPKTNVLSNLGDLYLQSQKIQIAKNYYIQAVNFAITFKDYELKTELLKKISFVYSDLKNLQTALDYYRLYSKSKDSLNIIKNKALIADLKDKDNKKKLEINLLLKEQKIKDREIKKQKQLKAIFIISSLVIFLIVIVVARMYQLKRKHAQILADNNKKITTQKNEIEKQNTEIKEKNIILNQQKEEILVQRDHIENQKEEAEKQRDKIALQKEHITDSIRYASYIQSALLPPSEIFTKHIKEHFILFKPKEIVSGDFYWISKQNGLLFIAAADCTGHGVPGAFMSVLGISLLNDIVEKEKIIRPDMILNQLRQRIKNTLHQTGKRNEAKDGMDISLCAIDTTKNVIQFAGAFNPLIHISNGKIEKIKADRMPVGIHFKNENNFTLHEIPYLSGDKFYMLSDGYIDQFGGDDGKKLMMGNFLRLLETLQQYPISQQKDLLDDFIQEWKREIFEQIDDILVLGFEV